MSKKEKLSKHDLAIHKEVTKKSVSYITAAFGLVAGLAWNDAIVAAIDVVFPSNQGTIIAKFIYAVVFTAVLVIVTVQINKFLAKKSD